MTLFRKNIFHSVVFQIVITMALIASMALASMSLSVYVTADTQGDAEAINLAGSLRMQSYRIGHALYRASEGTLTDAAEKIATERQVFTQKILLSQISETVRDSGNTPLNKSYQRVIANWQQETDPLLQAAQDGQLSWLEARDLYDLNLKRHVNEINFMVRHLQRDNEGKIELLGMTEGVSIIFIVLIVLFFVMKTDRNFVEPLRGLVRAAQRVQQGELSQRILYRGHNELGLLSQTFNDMTESLEAQYRTLEEQVEARTEELRRSNQALSFINRTTRELTARPHNQQLLTSFLFDLRKIANVELIDLCVNIEPNFQDYDLITTDPGKKQTCVDDCKKCGQALGRPNPPDLSLPLKNRDDLFGYLYVSGGKLDSWQLQLLHTVTETLSTAFAFHHTQVQERRVILLEERSMIARELHDSLAQSLSYMKMETARLRKMIEREFDQHRIDDAISDLQEGLNAAYKHLRELLVTFRVKLDAPNLRTALENAVLEFAEQTAAEVELQYGLGGYVLAPNEDIHILHILREAINNAVKHAHASRITLRCSRRDSGEFEFVVEDDGVGIKEDPEKEHHYGVYTMRERAQQLGAAFSLTRRESGGTRVELRLHRRPELLSA